jgi:nucleoside phosphorylase
VGIAGGVKDVALGDVVVATKICHYEAGKDTAGGFRPRPEMGHGSYRLLERARAEARKSSWAKDLGSQPKVLLGPIAAGEKVVASSDSVTAKFLREQYGDVVAIEMEGAGFLRSAEAHSSLEVLVVRGISDLLSDKSASDAAGWQPRAAKHAAHFALHTLGASSGR